MIQVCTSLHVLFKEKSVDIIYLNFCANKKQFLLKFVKFYSFIANFWRNLRFQSQERQNFLQMQSKPLTVITYVVINCECDHIDPS